MTKSIHEHEGKKYIRRIRAVGSRGPIYLEIDVYEVFEAFNVTDQAVGHAIKKLLCLGERGKGDRLADLKGVEAAISRAIELEERRIEDNASSPVRLPTRSGFDPGVPGFVQEAMGRAVRNAAEKERQKNLDVVVVSQAVKLGESIELGRHLFLPDELPSKDWTCKYCGMKFIGSGCTSYYPNCLVNKKEE